MNPILLQYEARLVALHASASQLRLGQMVALAIVAVAIAAFLIILFFSVARHSVPLPVAVVPLFVAAYSGRLGKIRRSSLSRTLRLATFYERGIARLTGKWAGSGVAGDDFIPRDHHYGNDLNVFGCGSLFELLCTCRTQVGRRRLADFLLQPVPLEEALRRQDAVKELKGNAALREEISLLGEHQFQDTSWGTVKDWLQAPFSLVHPSFRVIALISTFALVVLVLLGWDQLIDWDALRFWISGLLLVNGFIGLQYRNKILASAQAIRIVGMDLDVLRQGLMLLHKQKFTSSLLVELVEGCKRADAPRLIRKLERLINAFVERDKEYFYLFSRLLLIGTQLFWAIERWRQRHGESMERWLSIWGEFEALASLATYAHEHPENTFPLFSGAQNMFDAEGMGHPLLRVETCVTNSIALNQKNRFYLISGSNMAGKSTLLRAIGLNTLLAYAGAPVCAERLELSRFKVCTSLAIEDSLLDGKSKFLAEIDRLRLVLAVPPVDGPVLFLIDELLSGTNSMDRRIVAEAVLRELIKRGAVGALSTHDLSLSEVAKLDGLHGMNMHMSASDDTDSLNFDYLLKPGITRQSNAIAIARLAGVPC